MQTLAACRLDEAFELEIGEAPTDLTGGADHILPFDPRPRIEVEHQPVGLLETIDRRPADMDFEHACLGQGDEAGEIVDGNRLLSVRLLDQMEAIPVHAGGCVLLIEGLPANAVGRPHQRQHPPGDVWLHPLPDLVVIFGQHRLGDAGILPIDALRVCQRHSRHRHRTPGLRGGFLRSRLSGCCLFHGRSVLLLDLAGDLLCRLVLADAFEGRLTDVTRCGPAAKIDLDHDVRPDPFDRTGALLFRNGAERASVNAQRLQTFPPLVAHAVGEARPGPAGVAKAQIVVIPQNQRSHSPGTDIRWGIACDHQLLTVGTLDLEPIAGPTGPVWRLDPFRHDAFKPQVRSELQHLQSIDLEILGHAHHAVARKLCKQIGQRRLALGKRGAGDVIAVEMEEIEGVVDQTVPPAALEVVLQGGKVGDSRFVSGYDFSIDDGVVFLQGAERGRNGGEPRGPVESGSGAKLNRPVADPRLHAVTVELYFMHPASRFGRSSGERCQAR